MSRNCILFSWLRNATMRFVLKKTYFDKTSVTILKYLIKTTIITYNLPFSITFYQSSFCLFTQSSHTHFIFLLLLLLLSISLSFLFLNASEQQGDRNDICLISVGSRNSGNYFKGNLSKSICHTRFHEWKLQATQNNLQWWVDKFWTKKNNAERLIESYFLLFEKPCCVQPIFHQF